MDIHRGSLETFQKIADWGGEELPFSKYLRWDRMGLLAILADYVLNYSKGNIVEIGAGESSVYLNKLAVKYNRKAFFCDVQRSIYINALTVPGYFSNDYIILEENGFNEEYLSKQSIIYIGTSDSFFKRFHFQSISVAFIDGEHTYEQAKKDFYNILPLLDDLGYIFLHDTLPLNEDYLDLNSCGTVYKLRQELEKDPLLEVFTFPRSAIDVGLTMVRKKPDNLPYYKK